MKFKEFIKEEIYPVLKKIIKAYSTSTDFSIAVVTCASHIVQMRQPFYDTVLHGNAPQFGSTQTVLADIAHCTAVVPLYLCQWTFR